MHEEQSVSAGASGAIFGLMGALLYVVIANRGRLGDLSGKRYDANGPSWSLLWNDQYRC